MSDRPHGLTRAKHGPDEHGNPGKGCHCEDCKKACRDYDTHRDRMIAYGWWDKSYLDAAGTRRRLQALIRCGWSQQALSARLGWNKSRVSQILACPRVTPATAARIRVLYDDLWNQAPPERTQAEKGSAAKARKYARRQGFQPAGAWDDDPGPHFIDDPQAVPVPGCIRGERREWGVITEEVVELGGRSGNPAMAGVNEHPEMIAQRLGANAKTVERTLQRAGQQPWRAATERAA